MNLPKLYAPVWIKFWSLRNGLGQNMGVIFDVDTEVERRCMRVRTSSGWKWQVCNLFREAKWDGHVWTDQDILTEYGSDVEVELITGSMRK